MNFASPKTLAAALREGGGFAVDHAPDGIEGELLAKQGCYDVVILDLMLPGQSGQTLLRRLRASDDATPYLSSPPARVPAPSSSCSTPAPDDYLSKPFDLGELMARVQGSHPPR